MTGTQYGALGAVPGRALCWDRKGPVFGFANSRAAGERRTKSKGVRGKRRALLGAEAAGLYEGHS